MHVVQLIARLNAGGPARVLAALCPALRAHGITSEVIAGVCPPDERDDSSLLRDVGITVTTLPTLGRSLSPWSDARSLLAVLRRLRQPRPDILHTHTAKAGLLGRIAARVAGVPCIHTYHGHVLDGYFSRTVSTLVRASERLAAGDAWHQALTDSQHHDLAVRHGIGHVHRWQVLPIPVQPPLQTAAAWHDHLPTGVPVVGFLGRLTAVKDPHLWLETIAALAARRPVHGLLCGDGSEREALAAHITKRGLPVTMTGMVPAGEALARMDVLVMSSRNEGLPVACIEALGAQPRPVPVVAPAVGGLRDLIARNAVFAAERTAPSLAAMCDRVLNKQFDHQAWVQNAAHVVQQLAPDVVARAYAAWYRRIVSEAKR